MRQARMQSPLIRSRRCGPVLQGRDAKAANALESCHSYYLTNWKIDPLVYLELLSLLCSFYALLWFGVGGWAFWESNALKLVWRFLHCAFSVALSVAL